MASGYIARLPQSAWQRLMVLRRLVDLDAYGLLCRDYDLRYLVLPAGDAEAPSLASARLVYVDRAVDAEVFDLAPDGRCIAT